VIGRYKLLRGILIINLSCVAPAAMQPADPASPSTAESGQSNISTNIDPPPPQQGTGGDDSVDPASFIPSLVLSPPQGRADDTVGVLVACRDNSTQPTFTIGSASVPLSVISGDFADGTYLYTASFVVPDIEPRTYTAAAECDGASPQASFTVLELPTPSDPVLTLTPGSGQPGSELHFSGIDLPTCPGGWSVALGDNTLTTIEADTTLDYTATVPNLPTGSHPATITCTNPDYPTTAQATFQVLPGQSGMKTSPKTSPSIDTPTTTPGDMPTPTTNSDETPTTAADPAPAASAADLTAPTLIAAAVVLTSGSVAIARFATRTRRSRRWIRQHLRTRQQQGPASTQIIPGNPAVGPSLHLEIHCEKDAHSFEEGHDGSH
jgi:hypothetical protein